MKLMAERAPLLSVDDALAAIASALIPTDAVKTPVTDARGGVLAEPVMAVLDHPPVAVSAMDGYAARAADLTTLPATLNQIGESAAGHPWAGQIGAGECIRIFTGAACPDTADTIILQEDTETEGNDITIHEIPAPGRFIRPKGQDFANGQVLFEKGVMINARNLALIGSAGHGMVSLRRRPVVAIISTGDELVEPGVTPKEGQIISSNGIFLQHLVAALGGEPMPLGIIPDRGDALDAAFEKAMQADLIVTSGGASVGAHDGVAHRMQHDSDLAFWRIAMRPGKPLLFGHIGNGAERTPLLGLPGNPVSTGVCGMIFVAAAIRRLLGQDYLPEYRHAVLKEPLSENDRRQDFLRARLDYSTDGQLVAAAFSKQDSGMLSVFAEADALIMRPPHAPAAPAGEIVPILILPEMV